MKLSDFTNVHITVDTKLIQSDTKRLTKFLRSFIPTISSTDGSPIKIPYIKTSYTKAEVAAILLKAKTEPKEETFTQAQLDALLAEQAAE